MHRGVRTTAAVGAFAVLALVPRPAGVAAGEEAFDPSRAPSVSARTQPREYMRFRRAWKRSMQEQARSGRLAADAVARGGASVTLDTNHSSNVQVSSNTTYAGEDSIAVDPGNPLNLATGANDFNAPNGINGTYSSTDGGTTWFIPAGGTPDTCSGDPWGDPSINFAAPGTAVFSSLFDGLDGIAGFLSTTSGTTWQNGSNIRWIVGGNEEDKNWTAGDTTAASPYYGRFYVTWDHYTTTAEDLAVSRSTAPGVGQCTLGSAGWSAPYTTVATNRYYPNIAVGPNGNVYISALGGGGAGNQTVHRSTDGGVTWAAGVNAYSYVLNAAGLGGQVGNGIMAGLDVDRNSASAYYNRVYHATVDARAGQARFHIWLRYSTDNGATWNPGTPIQVDEDTGDTHEHAYPWLTVSPNNGEVHVYYYDFGCGNPGSNYRYMLASSADGGATWRHMAVQDVSRTWTNNRGASNWVGDYQGGDESARIIYPHWSDDRAAGLQSYVQPVPNPMPWISSVSPSLNPGTTTNVTINGGNLMPTVTPFAIAFDDAAITATIVSATNVQQVWSVTVPSTGVAPGPHEFTIKYGLAVGAVTVVAVAKSGCQFPVQVTGPSFTNTPTPCVFGYNQSGSGAVNGATILRTSGWTIQFTAQFNQAYVWTNTAGANVVLGVYTNAGGAPGTKLVQTNPFPSVAGGWATGALQSVQTLTSGTTYWLAFETDSGNATMFNRDNPPNPVMNPFVAGWIVNPFTYVATLPNNWPGGATTNTVGYCAYLACGGGNTPTVTRTATRSATTTVSATSTATRTRTSTWCATASPTPSSTATRSASPTQSETASGTPTATLTAPPSVTATFSSSSTPTRSATESRTSSPTETRSGTATISRTPSITATVGGPTDTVSRTATVSPTASPSRTETRTDSPTETETPTPSATPTSSPTSSPTDTPPPTATATDTPTFTSTDTATRTFTRTTTLTFTSLPPTNTFTASFTTTRTSTNTRTFTAPSTPSATFTHTSSATIPPTATPSPAGGIGFVPNPVRAGTSGAFVGVPAGATVEVFNARGELILTLVSLSAGRLDFNLRAKDGAPLARGSYVWVVTGRGFRHQDVLAIR